MNLSPVQEEIVNMPGNLIVRASAGTGKTHTMVSKIAKEISENKTHKVVAAITFTIKAAQEIKDRLSIDVSRHFIGTNNSFVIEEIIKPFMKDVYGSEYALDMSTDYSNDAKVQTYIEGIEKIKNYGILCSYVDNKENFIFELAQEIVEKSQACRLFLQAKYFKIYIDEYQDCDRAMHKLFMYLCDTLGIEMFVVGDEKQSIYIWRGAYPQAFSSILKKTNFASKFMGDNFRSCKQIQNYSNLLYPETRCLYSPIDNLNSILWLNTTEKDWASDVFKHIDISKKSALLRYSNNNARLGAEALSLKGVTYTYIPQIPIDDITTDTAWLYFAIAKYLIIEKYSAYDLVFEIPVEGNETLKSVSKIKKMLKKIKQSTKDEKCFYSAVNDLAIYLGCVTKNEHIKKLFETVKNEKYYVAFELEKYQHIAITLHSSKGLEFDQVVIFAEDYYLSDVSSLCNHYVAVTRAKNKLIIVKLNNIKANIFQMNLEKIFSESNVNLNDVLIQI